MKREFNNLRRDKKLFRHPWQRDAVGAVEQFADYLSSFESFVKREAVENCSSD